MKRAMRVTAKGIVFFVGWAVCASLLPIPAVQDAAWWRFWAELIPLAAIAVITAIFWRMDRGRTRLHLADRPAYSAAWGTAWGLIWLGTVVGILLLTGTARVEDRNIVTKPVIWMLSALLNTIMQEMLVRGYLYQMVKREYNAAAATVVSTALFTFAHGGAFEAGVLPVLNIITMSLLMTAAMTYTGSLIAPIVMHFLWNGLGAIVLGGVSLAEDYPHWLQMVFSGSELLNGGSCKLEGSVVVLAINLLLTAAIVWQIVKRKRA